MDSSLMLLIDGRFPAGGHAYSAGVEAAVSFGDVVDVASLERYLHGRLATSGRVDAAFAANACATFAIGQPGPLRGQTPKGATSDVVAIAATLDAEYSARVMSAYLRSTSRRLGRQFVRAAARIWPSAGVDAVSATPGGPHQPIAIGAVVAAAGGSPADAAALVFHHLGAAVTSAAIRLLGLDPIELAAVQAAAGRAVDAGRDDWAAWSSAPPSDLPASGGSLTEILGERHGGLDARLFIA